MRGETNGISTFSAGSSISIHSPHARGDLRRQRETCKRPLFQSTPLMRGETDDTAALQAAFDISIHSPHARGDPRAPRPFWGLHVDFNPLPSCEGRRFDGNDSPATMIFQSTPLMRGETWFPLITQTQPGISIHSPHARGDRPLCRQWNILIISIHSPHARGDFRRLLFFTWWQDFNPLPSCEGRQHKPPKIRLDSRQSIQQKHHSSFF